MNDNMLPHLINQIVSARSSRVFCCINLQSIPILEQLLLEEALYRALPLTVPPDNSVAIMITNTPPKLPKPSIVMGLSGRPAQILKNTLNEDTSVPIIRRYSGGGTVVINDMTILSTLMLPHSFTGIKPYPKPVMEWVYSSFYKHPDVPPVFGPQFGLLDDDFIVNGDQPRKVGGNAQALSKHYSMQHTSFVWDPSSLHMDNHLSIPVKQPTYRRNRPHDMFVTSIKQALSETHSNISNPFQFMNLLREHSQNIIQNINLKSDMSWQFLNYDLDLEGNSRDKLTNPHADRETNYINTETLKELVELIRIGRLKNLRSTFLVDKQGQRLAEAEIYPNSHFW